MAELEDRIKAAYLRHFEETKDSSKSWNQTLEEIAGPYDPDSEEKLALREQVGRFLRKNSLKLDYESGDPYARALYSALNDLKRDKVAENVRKQYIDAIEDAKSEIRKKKKLDVPKGPKEWTPRKEAREEEVERIFEREREMDGGDSMTLYILFDDKGGLEGWNVDFPSYWPGHSGPSAQIPVHENLDYDDIQSGISEAFEEVDWDEVQEELEEDDHE